MGRPQMSRPKLGRPKMGRPRSVLAHRQVLDAAANLFADRGIDATSMDGIATASGVSKATIYKHWADKDELALEVLSYVHGLDKEVPVFDSGDTRTDLIAQLNYQPAPDRSEIRERFMPHVIAYSAHNRVFGAAWRKTVVEKQRFALGKILERGVKERQLIDGLDRDLSIAMLVGPMIYRRIFLNPPGDFAPLDFAEQVVDAFWKAFACKPRSGEKVSVRRKSSKQS
jgi:AcrR family transcriptional regulator